MGGGLRSGSGTGTMGGGMGDMSGSMRR
jgi:hypothetical protein